MYKFAPFVLVSIANLLNFMYSQLGHRVMGWLQIFGFQHNLLDMRDSKIRRMPGLARAPS